MSRLTKIILILFATLLSLFWLLPLDKMPTWITWLGILLVTGSTLYLSLVYRRILANWRSFGILVVALYLALAWLYWQWSLWESPLFFLQSLNMAICILAWALCIGVGVSSLLLLIHRDASVIFLATTWIICPLLLLGAGTQYEQLERLSATTLGEQLPWGIPFMWMAGIWCLAPFAFLIHLGIVVYRELKAR